MPGNAASWLQAQQKGFDKVNFEKWIGGCLVTVFPWIGGEQIYFNVRYFAPGSSLSQPPKVDKTVYITDDDAGRRLVYEYTDTLTAYVRGLTIPVGGHATIKVER